MLKKVLYVILAIAFLIGTHLIAQEEEALGPDARPSASASAGTNEAKATASLDPVREALVEVGNPVAFTGTGTTWARVYYYFDTDEDRSPDDGVGEISVTLTATKKLKGSVSSSQSQEATGDANGELDVGVGVKKGKISAGAELDADVELTEESETAITAEIGFETEVTPTHDNQEARVEGNKNHFKSSVATAFFKTLDQDNASYKPSFLEYLTPW